MNTAPTPPTVEHLDDYLRRRNRSGLPLRDGEVVTLAVGVLRGCHDTVDRARGASWGLTARGCPVLKDDPAGADALTATADVLARVASVSPPGGGELVERSRESVLTLPPPMWEQVERRLFAWADPVPLVLGPLAPRADVEPSPYGETTTGAASPLLAVVDADVAAMASEAGREIVARWRAWRHRRAFVFGVAVAGAAVAAVLMLPSGEREAASADAPLRTSAEGAAGDVATAPPSDRAASTDPSSSPSGDGISTDMSPSPTDAARSLLREWAACAHDTSCQQTLRDGAAMAGEAPPLIAEDVPVSLVDDFGGLAVVRVGDGSSASYLTIVQVKGRWLIRAVGTVADQPS